MPASLINFWQRCPLDGPLFPHPEDWPVLTRQGGRHIDAEPKDFATFVAGARFGDFADTRLHMSLLPIPYGGDLRAAEIVILLLNPGFSFTDYYAETRVPAFRTRLERTLTQDFSGTEFPFLWLDPEYCWHSGFVWWERKLRDVAHLVAERRFNGRYLDALRDLARRVAHVELVPYHSPSFRAHGLIDDLPSVRLVRQFARTSLAAAATRDERTIIVTRQVSAWGLPPDTRNLIVYEGGQTRNASLGRTTPGGRAILARYGLA
jgi:hypothetical protein